jgi:hypothetical protein
MRDEVRAFCDLGPLPSEQDSIEGGDDEAFAHMEKALRAITKPVTDEEARLLMTCFGDDDCFGLAWTLLHLVEAAPSPAVTTEPAPGSNPWLLVLWRRYQNSLQP